MLMSPSVFLSHSDDKNMWIESERDEVVSYKVDLKAKDLATPNVSSPTKTTPSLSVAKTTRTQNPLLNKALDDLERCQDGGCKRTIAEAWNALGLVRLHTQRDPQEALRCHDCALQLLESMGGNDVNSDLAATLNDLGLCHERLGDKAKAMQLYQRAREVLEGQDFKSSHERLQAVDRAIARVSRA
eukprot:Nitzschia sp. Nitz4//scaffold63_size106090//81538//82095//NITZ4_004406-RA/size106090-processed-gene-0.133-mRNA-1//1//CDS//3329556023//2148//frame0